MFLTFAIITLASALAMLLQKNVIAAGLCMVVTFLGVSGLFLLLSNPVAAALQIIVYAGAILVLVLFVIMLLNSHEEEAAESPKPIQRWLSLALVSLLGLGVIKGVLGSPALHAMDEFGFRSVQKMTLERIGETLLREHLLSFEVVGLLLLAAMVGAVALTKKEL